MKTKQKKITKSCLQRNLYGQFSNYDKKIKENSRASFASADPKNAVIATNAKTITCLSHIALPTRTVCAATR